MRRSYAYRINSPIAVEWDADLQKLPYDDRNSRWTEASTMAQIQRKYVSGWVMYVVDMYSENVDDKNK